MDSPFLAALRTAQTILVAVHVRPDGACVGTIGGGAVERQSQLDALALWADESGEKRKTYDLSHAAAELGMVCGGKIEVEFQVKR